MPALSMFYGIIIRMYFYDDKQHHIPHIHAEYADQRAVFSIPSGEIIAGNLAPNKAQLVKAWIEIHQEELAADWSLATNGQEPFKIDPLKYEVLMNPYVKAVKPLADYRIELVFENGEVRIFDLTPYVNRGIFSRLANPAIFQSARVAAGSVEWHGDLDLSYDTLYLESKQVQVKFAGVEPARGH